MQELPVQKFCILQYTGFTSNCKVSAFIGNQNTTKQHIFIVNNTLLNVNIVNFTQTNNNSKQYNRNRGENKAKIRTQKPIKY